MGCGLLSTRIVYRGHMRCVPFLCCFHYRLQKEYAPNSWEAIDAILQDSVRLAAITQQMFNDADSNNDGVLVCNVHLL